MNEIILEAIGEKDVNLCVWIIIIGNQRIGNEGLQFLCSQELSHVTRLYLGKTIDIKRGAE
jgi:hypothetical protein